MAPIDGESALGLITRIGCERQLTRVSLFSATIKSSPIALRTRPGFTALDRDSPLTDGPRKRRSRWGDATERTEVPGLPVAVMGKVSQTELDNYAIHVRLEEINRKLRTGDVVPPDGQRYVLFCTIITFR